MLCRVYLNRNWGHIWVPLVSQEILPFSLCTLYQVIYHSSSLDGFSWWWICSCNNSKLSSASSYVAFAQRFITCIVLIFMILIKVCPFAGGQKSRVAFAKITFKKPHIILLDEPSNHLVMNEPPHLRPLPPWLGTTGSGKILIFCLLQDLDAVEALIQGLLIFQGGVLMVRTYCHWVTCVICRVKSGDLSNQIGMFAGESRRASDHRKCRRIMGSDGWQGRSVQRHVQGVQEDAHDINLEKEWVPCTNL
jgi:hypothetical protein